MFANTFTYISCELVVVRIMRVTFVSRKSHI